MDASRLNRSLAERSKRNLNVPILLPASNGGSGSGTLGSADYSGLNLRTANQRNTKLESLSHKLYAEKRGNKMNVSGRDAAKLYRDFKAIFQR